MQVDEVFACTVIDIIAANQLIVKKQVKMTVVRGRKKKFLTGVKWFLYFDHGNTAKGIDRSRLKIATVNV